MIISFQLSRRHYSAFVLSDQDISFSVQNRCSRQVALEADGKCLGCIANEASEQ